VTGIACYLSSHGYGHAVRSIEVVRHIARMRPGLRIVIVTLAPPFLFADAMESCPNIALRRAAVDFGLVQRDPRSFSLPATAKKLRALLSHHERIVERERGFLRREKIRALWCDIPFLPFGAAASLGLPAVGMGNFSWDWIYEYYSGFDPVFAEAADYARAVYAHASLYLELPHSPPPLAFPRREKIPLVTRTARFSREEARSRLGLLPEERAVLLGFSELALAPAACARLEALACGTARRGIRFIVPPPMRLELANALERGAGLDFPSLVAAADILVTKLGYGIVSDAVASRVPLVYTDRGDFPELPWLEALVRETVGGVFIGRGDFEAGRWEEGLDAASLLRSAARAQPLRETRGAEHAARRFLEHTGA